MALKYFLHDFLDSFKKNRNPALPLNKEIKGLFSIKEVIPHNNAEINVSNIITIITDSKQWSYAAFFPLRLENLKKKSFFSSPVLILIKSIVKRGCIAIGCITNDFKSFTDEMIHPKKDIVTTFYLLVDPLENCSGLMVRNCRDDNEPSVVEIHSICVFELERIGNRVKISPTPNLRLAPFKNWSRYYGITPNSMIEKIRLWEYKGLTEPKVMPWIEGLQITIYPGNEIHEALYLSGQYEPNTMVVLQKLLSPGDIFFDVGANIGCFSLYAARIVGAKGHVFAFEPSYREYNRLVENVLLNDITNVTTINVAVSDLEGKGMLNIACERHSGQNTLGQDYVYKGVKSIATEEVDTITLDKFVRTISIDRVDVIKLDIEGWEYKALLGACEILKKYRPALIIEITGIKLIANRNCIVQLESLLSNLGYRFWDIDDKTAELLPISNLIQSHSENIVAMFH